MMFESELRKIEAKLNIPYPERSDFIREMAGDLDFKYHKHLAEGINPIEAKILAINELSLSKENINELAIVHEGKISKILRALPQPLGHLVRDFSGVVPLVIFISFLIKELPMLEFLREGGLPATILVFLIGGFGISVNLKHAFRWFVIRDHSEQSLADFSSGSLYFAFVSILIGVINTAIGYRMVFSTWAQGNISDAAIRAGFGEPLAGLIVASAVAGVIVLLHGWLATWRKNIFVHTV